MREKGEQSFGRKQRANWPNWKALSSMGYHALVEHGFHAWLHIVRLTTNFPLHRYSFRYPLKWNNQLVSVLLLKIRALEFIWSKFWVVLDSDLLCHTGAKLTHHVMLFLWRQCTLWFRLVATCAPYYKADFKDLHDQCLWWGWLWLVRDPRLAWCNNFWNSGKLIRPSRSVSASSSSIDTELLSPIACKSHQKLL